MKTADSTARQQALHTLLSGEAVRRLAAGIEQLPAVPQTYRNLTAAIARQNVTIHEIACIVEADPGLTVRILQLVNSAFFGRAQRTTSISQAVNLLGMELLKSLVLSAHVSVAAEAFLPREFSLTHFQQYSIRIARLARRFVVNAELADDAFTAGIVHDIGKIVLALKEPLLFTKVLQRLGQTGEQHHLVEKELIGTSHAEAGAALLASWEIPFPIVECVAFHHCPADVIADESGVEILAVVHAADALTGIISCREPETRLDRAFLADTGYGSQIERWRAIAEDELAPRDGG